MVFVSLSLNLEGRQGDPPLGPPCDHQHPQLPPGPGARGGQGRDHPQGVRQVSGPRHRVQDSDRDQEHVQPRAHPHAALQVSDEAPGPQAVLPDHGRHGEEDRDPDQEDDGARRGREAGAAEVLQSLGRVQVQPPDAEGRPGAGLR